MWRCSRWHIDQMRKINSVLIDRKRRDKIKHIGSCQNSNTKRLTFYVYYSWYSLKIKCKSLSETIT